VIFKPATATQFAWLAQAFLFTCLGSSLGFAQVPFYQGKTITVIQGRDPGGAGDMRSKAATQFLQKYIPGSPTIIHEYMGGGGGLRAANHIFSSVKPDGLTIGSVSSGMLSSAVLGGTGVKYDPAKFFYLGSPDGGGQFIFYTRKEAGIGGLEKLRATAGIRIGAQSVGHNNYNIVRILAYVLGLREPRFVTGYSSPEIDAAILRGELDGRTNQADSVLRRNPDWVERNLMDWHIVLEIPKGVKHPRFGHLPELETFARSQRDRKLIALQRSFRIVGSPFILPPATPRERVNILQEAMRNAFRDPQFPKEYKKLTGDDPEIVMPEVLEKSIEELPRDPEIIELMKLLAGPNPLPPA
jgi:tripartite-type tricarboxylate transporter receptor subunit TctC